MAFLVADLDDFMVAATDDFLVTEDDTVPGSGIGFENVNVGIAPATWARLGAIDLSRARIGSTIIWEEILVPSMAPAPAYLEITGFAPTPVAFGPIFMQPASATMAISGLAPSLLIVNPSTGVTYIGPGGIAMTSMTTGAALPFSSDVNSFIFDY